MLNKLYFLSSQSKKRLAILSSVILLFVMYSLALEPSIDALKLNKELTEKSKTHLSKTTIQNQKKLLHQIEKHLKSSESDVSILRKKILNQVTTLSEKYNLNIVQIEEPIIKKDKGITIVHNIFEIEGGFENLNKFLFTLEETIPDAHVVSTKYSTRMNRTTKSKELILTIYFQSIIFNTNE